jgi:endonuclease/exonuclease/phosphatase family metal-dependent hydrolase
LALWAAILPLLAFSADGRIANGPRLLDFSELVTLADTNQPPSPLAEKLDMLLRSPFVNNDATAASVTAHRPRVEGLGPVVRVASWNIERGLNFDLIRLALSDPEGFIKAAAKTGGFDANKRAQIENELAILREADIVLLNEADFGMKRTDYRDVARELARALGMNYVFGVEFVEVDRLEDLGVEEVDLGNPELTQKMREELRVDQTRYLGLHGNAILSRYPMVNARIFRLPVCHDWYGTEKAAISKLEAGKRMAANKVFLERIEREVRVGGRMALIADVRIPDLRTQVATVVNVHLENKCPPECRTKQMDALLAQIKDVDHPLIMAGDLNTTGRDGTPTSIRREILKRLKDYEFWLTQALKWGTPASVPLAALTPVKYFKNFLDPTSAHLPVIGSNKESILFRHVERFRFRDEYAFDFRGDGERTLNEKERTLANSNQRAFKGFTPTFTVKRDFGGLVGRFKLDWFFVKPFISEPRGEGMSYEFAPHFPHTMRDLNDAVPDGVSDHAPITVDLPFFGVESLSRESAVPAARDGGGSASRRVSPQRFASHLTTTEERDALLASY